MKFLKYLLLILLIFSSCKSKKAVVNGVKDIESLSARKVAKKHVSANFDKKTIDAKLKVNYKDSKEDVGFSVRMKIKKDEVIYLKGTKIITVFKAKITPTKVSFYSPYYKNYFEGDFSMLKKMLGVDINFKQLQNMLLGQSLLDVKSKRYEVEIVEKSYRLSPKKHPNLFDFFLFVNPLHFKLNKQLLVSSLKNQRLEILYPQYVEKNGAIFPKKIVIKAKESRKFTLIDISTRSVVFNTDLSMPFKIPMGYKEIKL